MRRLARLPAWCLTAGLAVVWLLIDPATPDLAAHEYRAEVFRHEGFAVWNTGWYGGHHLPGYSLLFPPVSALLTPQVAAALAAVVSSWCFERLARNRWGEAAHAGTLFFAVAALSPLVAGQLAFAFGAAFAFAALLAAQTRRPALALLLAACTPLGSPVAAMFLCLALVAWLIADRTLLAAGMLAATVLFGALLVWAFPEGGVQPYGVGDVVTLAIGVVIVFILLPREERELRTGAVLYLVAVLAVGLLDTPVGGNIVRLGALMAGPLVLCALWGRRPAWVLTLIVLSMLAWQWNAPTRNVVEAAGNPSRAQSYFRGLLAELDARVAAEGPARVEVPFTEGHWEARWLPPRLPQARGWERQLDAGRNTVFYGSGPLTPDAYRAWVDENAIRWIALPDVPLDRSAKEEAGLIAGGKLPWLREVWRDRHWRLYEVDRPTPLASGPVTVTSVDTDELHLRASRAGTSVVRVRWTPYWALEGISGCVEPATPWTRVTVRRAGTFRLVTRVAPGRIGSHAPRCTR